MERGRTQTLKIRFRSICVLGDNENVLDPSLRIVLVSSKSLSANGLAGFWIRKFVSPGFAGCRHAGTAFVQFSIIRSLLSRSVASIARTIKPPAKYHDRPNLRRGKGSVMVKVVLNSLANSGPRHLEFAQKAVALLEKIVNSEEFAHRIRRDPFSDMWRMIAPKQYRRSSAAELLELILSGRELGEIADFEIDLNVALVVKEEGKLGSTPIGGPVINTAYWFIDRCIRRGDAVDLAGHWLHEWTHSAGYYHLDQDNDDPRDAPYMTGRIAREVGRAINENAVARKLVRSPDGTVALAPEPEPDPIEQAAEALARIAHQTSAELVGQMELMEGN